MKIRYQLLLWCRRDNTTIEQQAANIATSEGNYEEANNKRSYSVLDTKLRMRGCRLASDTELEQLLVLPRWGR